MKSKCLCGCHKHIITSWCRDCYEYHIPEGKLGTDASEPSGTNSLSAQERIGVSSTADKPEKVTAEMSTISGTNSPQESQVGLATEGSANFKDKPEVPIKTELGNSPSGTKTQKGCGVSFFEGECRYICGKEGLCPYCKECEDGGVTMKIYNNDGSFLCEFEGDLSNANLRNANLRNANLKNADLSNADLWDANLSNANLKNADLSNADLWDANLSNANLKNAILPKKECEDV